MDTAMWRGLGRLLLLTLLAGLCLQLYFVVRIAMMSVVDPQSTAFQRSEALRIASEKGRLPWRQEWRRYDRISVHLKRAVIASEDASFAEHEGVDWEAIETAWEKNQKAEARAERLQVRGNGAHHLLPSTSNVPMKLVGGSTITQQLAKNLFLSGERTLMRKGQELALTFMLEVLLSKERIFEIYLNSVEWGEGVFGAEAAARHYFRTGADRLTPWQAARLAVMLPRPKYFERRPGSAYLAGRSEAILVRMPSVEVP